MQMCPLQMSEIRVPVTCRPRGHECRRAVAFAFKQLSSVAFGHTAVWWAASQLAQSVSRICLSRLTMVYRGDIGGFTCQVILGGVVMAVSPVTVGRFPHHQLNPLVNVQKTMENPDVSWVNPL